MINPLAFMLWSLVFIGFMVLYAIIEMYLDIKKNKGSSKLIKSSSAIPITILSIIILLFGLYLEFTWPLASVGGSYNILFGDAYLMVGILLLSFSLSIILNLRVRYTGFLGMLMGLSLFVYGIWAYLLNMTQSPLATLGLYISFGLSAILSFPILLTYDKMVENNKMKINNYFKVAFYLFCVFLVIALLISLMLAFVAVTGHLSMYLKPQ